MIGVTVVVLVAVAAFVAGVLVGRRNRQKVEKAVAAFEKIEAKLK